MSTITSNFDTILWRFNGIIIATLGVLATLAALLLLSFSIYKKVFGQRIVHNQIYSETRANSPQGENLFIGGFERAKGTPYFVATLNANQSSQQAYFSKSATSRRNYLYYNSQTKESEWLLNDNSKLFLKAHKVYKNPGSTERILSAHLYELVETDTNDNGRLTWEDHKSLLLKRLDGSPHTTILSGIEKIIGVHQGSKDKLMIFYSREGINSVQELDPTTGKLGEAIALASPPN